LVYKGLTHARFLKFQNYIAFVEIQIGKELKKNHSNNGGEYKYLELNKFFDEHDIQHQFSTPYAPQQNGIVEQKKMRLNGIYSKYVPTNKVAPLFLG